MNRFLMLSIWGLTICQMGASCKRPGNLPVPDDRAGPTAITWKKPAHFPDPVYDMSRNPLTEEGVRLGRFLFYDGILSRTNVVGCGTCHQQQAAFTHHGHELSHGVEDKLGVRNSPAVQNMAWNTSFFWDGGVHDLDLLPFNPIENPVEMDEKVGNVLEKLRKTAGKPISYPEMFKAAFGTEDINGERMMKALSQFMITMVSAASRYDYFKMGDANALNAQELEGLSIFRSKCASCHEGELFTDFSFRNNGLVPQRNDDRGRFAITGQPSDEYKFKVPSLRNVALTAPYMHDGRYHTLEEVMDHYTDSIRKSGTLDPLLMQANGRPGIALSDMEKRSLIAFLHSLSDEQFIRNEKLSDPGVGNAF